MDKFNQRKESMLSKDDKSSKGDWDTKIVSLCEKINLKENHYTTSSCSGRIVILRDQKEKEKGMFEFVSHDEVDFEDFWKRVEGLNGEFKFKQEAFILHVACKTIEDAKDLIEKGLSAGIKRSGIISLGSNIIVEINSTERIEFPMSNSEGLIVSKDFLKTIIERSNTNLRKNWEKLEKFESFF